MLPIRGLGLWGTGAGAQAGGQARATPTPRPGRAAGSPLPSLGLPLEGTFPALTQKAAAVPGASLQSTPCGLAAEPSRVLSPMSPAEGDGHPPCIQSPFPPPVGGSLQPRCRRSSVLSLGRPICSSCSAPTLSTTLSPSPPDSTFRGCVSPTSSRKPSLATPGPRTCPAVCALPQSALIPAAPGRGPLGPLLWTFLLPRVGTRQSHANQPSHLGPTGILCALMGASESLWAFRGKS